MKKKQLKGLFAHYACADRHNTYAIPTVFRVCLKPENLFRFTSNRVIDNTLENSIKKKLCLRIKPHGTSQCQRAPVVALNTVVVVVVIIIIIEQHIPFPSL